MAYKQSPIAYSRTSNMPGLEYSEEDLAQKERIASNALGITPPADLLDGEFFLKDNDPQDFYRTLYIKRGESLDKVVTFTNTGKAIFDGINIVNLDDDEEVTGVLPKRKIITAANTAPVNNVTEIIAYDGNKFQAVNKNDLTNKIKDDINAEIDIDNYYNKTESDDRYYNKTESDDRYFNKDTDGFGWKNAYSDTEFNAKIRLSYPFTTQQLVDAIMKLNQPVFCMVHGWRKGQSFITDFPSSDLSHRTIINFIDNNQFYLETIDPFNLTTYICNVSGGVAGKWIKTRNYDGSIPESLIPATQKVTVADGVTWIETPLNNGKSLLYGIAKKTPTGDGLTTYFWKMIPLKSIDASTIQLTANYLANSNYYHNLQVMTYGSIIDSGYKNIVVSENLTELVIPKYNFLLTMQAITA